MLPYFLLILVSATIVSGMRSESADRAYLPRVIQKKAHIEDQLSLSGQKKRVTSPTTSTLISYQRKSSKVGCSRFQLHSFRLQFRLNHYSNIHASKLRSIMVDADLLLQCCPSRLVHAQRPRQYWFHFQRSCQKHHDQCNAKAECHHHLPKPDLWTSSKLSLLTLQPESTHKGVGTPR